MRSLCLLIVVALSLFPWCAIQEAVAPMPRPLPAPSQLPLEQVLPKDLPIPKTEPLPITVPLPQLRENVIPRPHAVDKHRDDAWRARRAVRENPCRFYVCSASRSPNNLLRLCYLSAGEYAVQWLFYAPDLQAWVEGTSFVKKIKDVYSFLISKGCMPVD